MNPRQFNRVARALADPRRFDILSRITRVRGELSCKRLAEQLPVSRPTLSHHLKDLATAGLIDIRREGQAAYVRADRVALRAYLAEVRRRLAGAGKAERLRPASGTAPGRERPRSSPRR